MDWAAIIALVVKLIEDCRKTQSDAQIKANIRRGGSLVRFRLRQELRKAGVAPKDLADAVDDALEAARKASDEELDGLITMAKAADA